MFSKEKRNLCNKGILVDTKVNKARLMCTFFAVLRTEPKYSKHTWIHTYIHGYIHGFIHIYMDYIHTYMHTYMDIYMDSYIHGYIYMDI